MSINRARLHSARTHEVMRAEMLADPAAQAEYERLRPRFELIHAIIEARNAHDWTQTDLANACGASQSAIARLESGNHDPKWSTAVRACRALGLDIQIVPDPPSMTA